MDGFKKRTYHSLREFAGDMAFLFRNRRRIRDLFRGKGLSPAFRERMMLAVTQVNACRFCARFHSRIALSEGISREEVNAILDGAFQNCPPDELPGVLYAGHWAEMAGMPESEVRGRLVVAYGPETAGNIDVVLRVVRTGNLTGNTVDYLLNRVSFGVWGAKRAINSHF